MERRIKFALWRSIIELELMRLKLPLFIMVATLFVTGALLFGDWFKTDASFEFQVQGEAPDLLQTWSVEQTWTLLGTVGKTMPALLLGLVLAVLFPWRTREEWESGSLIHWQMSPHTSVRKEGYRFCTHLGILYLYFSIVIIFGVLDLRTSLVNSKSSWSFYASSIGLIFLVFIPFLLALSTLLSALRYSYWTIGRTRFLSFLYAINWFVWVHQFLFKLEAMLRSSKGVWFKPWELTLQSTSQISPLQTLYFYPEFIVLTGSIVIGFVILASQVMAELEVAS